jgi:diguanylate cyclase (GGDEF)-like protein
MRRYRHPFSVAYLDFDNFKFINDTLGHSVGDDLIRVVVETLNHELRKTDQAARLGDGRLAEIFSRKVLFFPRSISRIQSLLI